MCCHRSFNGYIHGSNCEHTIISSISNNYQPILLKHKNQEKKRQTQKEEKFIFFNCELYNKIYGAIGQKIAFVKQWNNIPLQGNVK